MEEKPASGVRYISLREDKVGILKSFFAESRY